jgi:hypothetical protein
MSGNKKTISFSVDKEEYEEIFRHARIKGHGGQFPASAFTYYALRQMMKKYPVSDKENADYEKRYGGGVHPVGAVQPEPSNGEKQGSVKDDLE